MSATDPLKRYLAQRLRFRAIPGVGAASEACVAPEPSARTEVPRSSYRPPNTDFYCWKYGVWYNLMDCCYRHTRQSYSGCADCGQGRNNLRQNKDRFYWHRHDKDPPFTR